jgi:hypothetical protein
MTDDFWFYTKLDRLSPTEKLTDPKERVVRQEIPSKKKRKKGEQEIPAEVNPKKKEGMDDPSKDKPSGKIVDIVI